MRGSGCEDKELQRRVAAIEDDSTMMKGDAQVACLVQSQNARRGLL